MMGSAVGLVVVMGPAVPGNLVLDSVAADVGVYDMVVRE